MKRKKERGEGVPSGLSLDQRIARVSEKRNHQFSKAYILGFLDYSLNFSILPYYRNNTLANYRGEVSAQNVHYETIYLINDLFPDVQNITRHPERARNKNSLVWRTADTDSIQTLVHTLQDDSGNPLLTLQEQPIIEMQKFVLLRKGRGAVLSTDAGKMLSSNERRQIINQYVQIQSDLHQTKEKSMMIAYLISDENASGIFDTYFGSFAFDPKENDIGLRLSFYSRHKGLLDSLQTQYGGNVNQKEEETEKRHAEYEWYLGDETMRTFLTGIQQHLFFRKNLVDLALSYLDVRAKLKMFESQRSSQRRIVFAHEEDRQKLLQEYMQVYNKLKKTIRIEV